MTPLLAPRAWGGHLLMVVCVAVATVLGLWQYDAWGERREAEARDLSAAEPRPLAEVIGPDDTFPGQDLGRPVTLEGDWMDADTLFVADRRDPGSDERGYWVVTPVRTGGAALPVVRGWAARPEAEPVTGRVGLTGWLQASEGDGTTDDDPTDRVLPQVRIASLVQYVDTDLYSAYVVAREPTAGLRAVSPGAVPEVSGFTALRNLLYAIEWWIFGAFAAFIWWRWCRDLLERQQVPSPV